MARFDKGGHGKIWQDVTSGTWQDLERFDKGDMSRLGKIWQDLARFDKGGAWQDLARFDKGGGNGKI